MAVLRGARGGSEPIGWAGRHEEDAGGALRGRPVAFALAKSSESEPQGREGAKKPRFAPAGRPDAEVGHLWREAYK